MKEALPLFFLALIFTIGVAASEMEDEDDLLIIPADIGNTFDSVLSVEGVSSLADSLLGETVEDIQIRPAEPLLKRERPTLSAQYAMYGNGKRPSVASNLKKVLGCKQPSPNAGQVQKAVLLAQSLVGKCTPSGGGGEGQQTEADIGEREEDEDEEPTARDEEQEEEEPMPMEGEEEMMPVMMEPVPQTMQGEQQPMEEGVPVMMEPVPMQAMNEGGMNEGGVSPQPMMMVPAVPMEYVPVGYPQQQQQQREEEGEGEGEREDSSAHEVRDIAGSNAADERMVPEREEMVPMMMMEPVAYPMNYQQPLMTPQQEQEEEEREQQTLNNEAMQQQKDETELQESEPETQPETEESNTPPVAPLVNQVHEAVIGQVEAAKEEREAEDLAKGKFQEAPVEADGSLKIEHSKNVYREVVRQSRAAKRKAMGLSYHRVFSRDPSPSLQVAEADEDLTHTQQLQKEEREIQHHSTEIGTEAEDETMAQEQMEQRAEFVREKERQRMAAYRLQNELKQEAEPGEEMKRALRLRDGVDTTAGIPAEFRMHSVDVVGRQGETDYGMAPKSEEDIEEEEDDDEDDEDESDDIDEAEMNELQVN